MREILSKARPRQKITVHHHHNTTRLAAWDIHAYRDVLTYGSRGQRTVHHGVAQFILDNAENNTSNGKGITTIHEMGVVAGVTLRNGYLKVVDNADAAEFRTTLQKHAHDSHGHSEDTRAWNHSTLQ